MSTSDQGKYKTFLRHGKEYLGSRYNLLRLELLEKLSSIVALLIFVMVALVLVTSVWVYISCILIVMMERAFGSFVPAFLIMGAISLTILVIIYFLKDQVILNPLIRRFSNILFDNPIIGEDEEENHDEDEDYE